MSTPETIIDNAIYERYQAAIVAYRTSPYLDYPSHVHMETLALCPAACNFCPYPTLDRKGTRMSDALIQKIIMDLKDIPDDLRFQLSPFKVNEPFLDNRLHSILKLINQELPNAYITLTTNASPLTEEKLASLTEIDKIGYLWVSTNAHQKAAYEEIMKLPWERTMQRLTMLHDYKTKGLLDFEIILSRVGDGTHLDRDFETWVAQTFPQFKSSVFQRGGWIGQVDIELPVQPPNIGCMRWFDLSITATGKVAHCCMDGRAEWPIGDINVEHILSVYNHPDYRKLREATTSRLEVDPCKRCTFL